MKKANTTPIKSEANPQLSNSLVKHRATRNIKPNSLIFTKDVQVNMPRKKNIAKKNVLINNAIKTINKKSKLVGNKLNKFKFKSTDHKLKKNLNSPKSAKLTAGKLTRRKYTKQDQTLDDQSSSLTSSTDDQEDSVSSENENKNSINLNSSKLNNLYKQQPLTKNGKPLGRPRKPIAVNNILDCFKDHPIADGLNCNNESFKNLLEKIDESHKNQIMQLKKDLNDKDKEKVLLDVKNAALMKENEMLRMRLAGLNSESDLRKELEKMKKLHSQEISEIKKKLWVINKYILIWIVFNLNHFFLNHHS